MSNRCLASRRLSTARTHIQSSLSLTMIMIFFLSLYSSLWCRHIHIVVAFNVNSRSLHHHRSPTLVVHSSFQSKEDSTESSSIDTIKRIQASSGIKIIQEEESLKKQQQQQPMAQTNTINQRLLDEIQSATLAEKGPKTKMASRMSEIFSYGPNKSAQEREAALEQARDLNGLDPGVTLLAGIIACSMAYGLWIGTQFLGGVFLSHPMSPDAPYMFARFASVFRNAVMGICSLASGFFFVTGLGITLLGLRVAQGVLSGELDPTKAGNGVIKEEEMVLPNVWDLMLGKKNGRRGGR